MRTFQLLFIFFFCSAEAQISPQTIISSPLNAPLKIVSTYGEIRPNHFHSGIDLSTGGISQQVIAAADGYISRVRKSVQGYGNVLYINHPTGITTVYAHLESFTDTLEKFVKSAQHRNRRFEFDSILPAELFPVKLGDFIASSGNSGSSTAPHLHFEVRDQQFENTINPLHFNFKQGDITPPVIKSVAFFPKEKHGTVNLLPAKLFLPLVLNKQTKKKGISPSIKMPVLSGWVSFGFQGGDVIEKKTHLSGIYEIKVLVDSQLIYTCRMDEFSFSETRNVNAFIDYASKVKMKRTIHHCVVPQNQMIGIFKQHQNQGYYYFDEDRIYTITYLLKDINENLTSQTIKVRGKKYSKIKLPNVSYENVNFLPSAQEVSISKEGIEVAFFEESLFDSTKVKLVRKSQPTQFSDFYEIGSIYTPVNQPFEVKIRINNTLNLPPEKYLIVRQGGKSKEALSSTIDGNWLKATSNAFGDFFVQVDTIAPTISRIATVSKAPAKKKKGKKSEKPTIVVTNLKAEGTIKFKIYDALSGVKQINAWLDEEWILLEPAAGANEWKFKFPENLSEGEHTFQIEAIDKSGNSSFVQYCPQKSMPLISP